ncbi:hypothetical protein STREPTOSP366_60170 [Streptomyces variabilis]
MDDTNIGELNDMTPYEVYEAVKAGHFTNRGEE